MKPVNSKTKPKRRQNSEQQVAVRLWKNLHEDKRIYQRWMAGPETTLSTGGGGVVALTTVANAASISGLSDFSSMQNLYTTYRCVAIRVDFYPLYTIPYYDGTTNVTMPAIVAVYPSFANTVPTSFQQALDVPGLRLMSGYKGGTISTTWRGDPDAHLWTGIGSAIGSNEQFLISAVGTSSGAAVSRGVFRFVAQYLVEFRIQG